MPKKNKKKNGSFSSSFSQSASISEVSDQEEEKKEQQPPVEEEQINVKKPTKKKVKKGKKGKKSEQIRTDSSSDVISDQEIEQKRLAKNIPQSMKKILMTKSRGFDTDKFLKEAELEEQEALEQEIIFEDHELDDLLKLQVKEEEYSEQIPRFMLRYNSKYRIRWDMVILIFVLWSCLSVPFIAAFMAQDNYVLLTIIELILEVCYVFDIIINFRTSFLHPKSGQETFDSPSIASNYIKSFRFYIDIASALPIELFLQIAGSEEGASGFFYLFIRLPRVLQITRLTKITKILRYTKTSQALKVIIRISQLLAFLFILVHWTGCILYMLVEEKGTWLPPMNLSAQKTEFYDQGLTGQYTTCFYYAILLIVGNEVAPTNTIQTVFASFVVIMGSIVTGFIFGQLADLIAVINKKDQSFTVALDMVTYTMRIIKLPEAMQDDVVHYMMYMKNSPDIPNEFNLFLSLLSPSIKTNVLQHVYKNVILMCQVFDQCSDIEIEFVVNKFQVQLYLPKDPIIREGSYGNKVCFISRGSTIVTIKKEVLARKSKASMFSGSIFSKSAPMEASEMSKYITKEDNEEKKTLMGNDEKSDSKGKNGEEDDRNKYEIRIINLRQLHQGQYFGEISLITNMRRTASVTSVGYTTLASISRNDFNIMKEEYPSIYQGIKEEMKVYSDFDIQFRVNMLRNVHYFKDLNDEIIREVMYLLRSHRFDANRVLVKCGDSVSNIYFLRSGEIEIQVPDENEKIFYHFDYLIPGSSFCVYTAFKPDLQQLVNFKTTRSSVVDMISVDDLKELSKKYLQLSDTLKTLEVEIDINEKNDFDFFRYRRPRPDLSEDIKVRVRRKFRNALRRFLVRYRQDKTILKMPAWDAITALKNRRMSKEQGLLSLQQRAILQSKKKSAVQFLKAIGVDVDDRKAANAELKKLTTQSQMPVITEDGEGDDDVRKSSVIKKQSIGSSGNPLLPGLNFGSLSSNIGGKSPILPDQSIGGPQITTSAASKPSPRKESSMSESDISSDDKKDERQPRFGAFQQPLPAGQTRRSSTLQPQMVGRKPSLQKSEGNGGDESRGKTQSPAYRKTITSEEAVMNGAKKLRKSAVGRNSSVRNSSVRQSQAPEKDRTSVMVPGGLLKLGRESNLRLGSIALSFKNSTKSRMSGTTAAIPQFMMEVSPNDPLLLTLNELKGLLEVQTSEVKTLTGDITGRLDNVDQNLEVVNKTLIEIRDKKEQFYDHKRKQDNQDREMFLQNLRNQQQDTNPSSSLVMAAPGSSLAGGRGRSTLSSRVSRAVAIGQGSQETSKSEVEDVSKSQTTNNSMNKSQLQPVQPVIKEEESDADSKGTGSSHQSLKNVLNQSKEGQLQDLQKSNSSFKTDDSGISKDQSKKSLLSKKSGVDEKKKEEEKEEDGKSEAHSDVKEERVVSEANDVNDVKEGEEGEDCQSEEIKQQNKVESEQEEKSENQDKEDDIQEKQEEEQNLQKFQELINEQVHDNKDQDLIEEVKQEESSQIDPQIQNLVQQEDQEEQQTKSVTDLSQKQDQQDNQISNKSSDSNKILKMINEPEEEEIKDQVRSFFDKEESFYESSNIQSQGDQQQEIQNEIMNEEEKEKQLSENIIYEIPQQDNQSQKSSIKSEQKLIEESKSIQSKSIQSNHSSSANAPQQNDTLPSLQDLPRPESSSENKVTTENELIKKSQEITSNMVAKSIQNLAEQVRQSQQELKQFETKGAEKMKEIRQSMDIANQAQNDLDEQEQQEAKELLDDDQFYNILKEEADLIDKEIEERSKNTEDMVLENEQSRLQAEQTEQELKDQENLELGETWDNRERIIEETPDKQQDITQDFQDLSNNNLLNSEPYLDQKLQFNPKNSHVTENSHARTFMDSEVDPVSKAILNKLEEKKKKVQIPSEHSDSDKEFDNQWDFAVMGKISKPAMGQQKSVNVSRGQMHSREKFRPTERHSEQYNAKDRQNSRQNSQSSHSKHSRKIAPEPTQSKKVNKLIDQNDTGSSNEYFNSKLLKLDYTEKKKQGVPRPVTKQIVRPQAKYMDKPLSIPKDIPRPGTTVNQRQNVDNSNGMFRGGKKKKTNGGKESLDLYNLMHSNSSEDE